ncbi:MAG: acyl-phosphate glycerol 3-phosphate acyltransferase [Candidatus Omnitrophota bacterium]|nr:MAG: acyl-phosphate glycerol 3-phosphate acyltransferase [Candidatus Omnitrophota bacterium]
MLIIILLIVISYLIGSIPTAYIFGRLIKGIDIRKSGSGNVGATNALRVLGKAAGVTVLLLDILKGFIVVIFIGNLIGFFGSKFQNQADLRLILGMSCIAGHIWTVFLNFKGGKGIATTFGVLLGLATVIPGLRIILFLIILTWLSVFFITKIVSISSVVGALTLPIYMLLYRQSLFFIISSVILSTFVIYRHKSNLKRLSQGKESRLFK